MNVLNRTLIFKSFGPLGLVFRLELRIYPVDFVVANWACIMLYIDVLLYSHIGFYYFPPIIFTSPLYVVNFWKSGMVLLAGRAFSFAKTIFFYVLWVLLAKPSTCQTLSAALLVMSILLILKAPTVCWDVLPFRASIQFIFPLVVRICKISKYISFYFFYNSSWYSYCCSRWPLSFPKLFFIPRRDNFLFLITRFEVISFSRGKSLLFNLWKVFILIWFSAWFFSSTSTRRLQFLIFLNLKDLLCWRWFFFNKKEFDNKSFFKYDKSLEFRYFIFWIGFSKA